MDLGGIGELGVREFARLRDFGEPHVLLDVREPWETAICAIDGSLNIPMAEITSRLGELPVDRPIVVLCHHGIRSARVAGWLRQNGFPKAINLQAGIHAWICEIDPSLQTY